MTTYEYAAVTRQTTILAQYAEVTGNFDVLVTEILQKINIRENQFVCERNGHKIFILRYEDLSSSANDSMNLYFVLVSTLQAQPNDSYSILDKMQRAFLLRYSRAWQSCAQYGLNKEFSGELKNVINSAQIKIQKIKDNMNETQNIMSDNLQKALLRNAQLEELSESASEISQASREYSRGAASINRKTLCNKLIIAFIVLLFIIALGFIIYLIAK